MKRLKEEERSREAAPVLTLEVPISRQAASESFPAPARRRRRIEQVSPTFRGSDRLARITIAGQNRLHRAWQPA